jgi:hypothetical protein
MRLESLEGMTPIQWLKKKLDELNYYNKIDTFPDTNKVRRLLYVHPDVVEIWRRNPDGLLFDYK